MVAFARITDSSDESKLLVEALRSPGYLCIEMDETYALDRARCLQDAQRFFWQSNAFKSQFRTPSSHGYLTPNPGIHEAFEIKKHDRDPLFQIPEPVRESWLRLYDRLEDVAVRVLEQASFAVAGNRSFLDLLDSSTFRLLHYDRLRIAPPDQIQSILADHTDSSFITVAPLSSCPSLEIREFRDLSWTMAEDAMTERHVLVFAGESLSRLTNNYFPSVLHRPVASRMLATEMPRVSMPFFLRGKASANLDIAMCDAAKVGEVDPSLREPVTVESFSDNVGGLRDALPWKKSEYFASFRYS